MKELYKYNEKTINKQNEQNMKRTYEESALI